MSVAEVRPYLDQVEERLHEAVAAYPGLVERLGRAASARDRC